MKKSNFFVLLAIVMMAFTQSVWADVKSPHFYLIGSLSGDNWDANQTNYPIKSVYESGTSKYYISVSIVEGTTYYFALHNGDNRYAPKGDPKSEGGFGQNKTLDVADLLTPTAVCVSQGNKTDAWYNSEIDGINVSNKSWKFTANYTGTLRICIDETPYDGKNDLEWYPYVWLERPGFYLIGDPISSLLEDQNTCWNADNKYCKLENKNAEGKYYVNLYLESGKSFALTHNDRRFAPKDASVEVNLNTDTHYSGSVENEQQNSWKYTGATGLVRLVLDVENNTFTLEPWQMYLIGAPAQEQGKIGFWDVKNTSTPLSTPYVNAEGNIEAGKFYREVLLDKDASFAFSDGILRYANDTKEKNKDISSSDVGQQGTYESSKQDNSWKFVDAASYVRVCIDYNNPKPYIWLEWLAPKEVYPIGDATTYTWEPNSSVAWTRVEGEEEMVYSGTLTLQAGELKFLCQRGWGDHYGPKVEGTEINVPGVYDVEKYDGGTPDNKFKIGLSGEYNMTLDATAKKLYIVPKEFSVKAQIKMGALEEMGSVNCHVWTELVPGEAKEISDIVPTKDGWFEVKVSGVYGPINFRYYGTGGTNENVQTTDMDDNGKGYYKDKSCTIYAEKQDDGKLICNDDNSLLNQTITLEFKLAEGTTWSGENNMFLREWQEQLTNAGEVYDKTSFHDVDLKVGGIYTFADIPVVNKVKFVLQTAKEGWNPLTDETFTYKSQKYWISMENGAYKLTATENFNNGPTTSVEQTSVVNDNIVYDIMGRALGTSVESLPQGIYVRNGKKFVVAQ